MNKVVVGRVNWTKAEIDRLIEIYPKGKAENKDTSEDVTPINDTEIPF